MSRVTKKEREAARYGKLLADPRWKKKREEVIAASYLGKECENCGETKGVQVHHGYYEYGKKPWEYENETLHVYCEQCHKRADYFRVTARKILGRLSLLDLERSVFYAIAMLELDTPNAPLPDLKNIEGLDGIGNYFGLTGDEIAELKHRIPDAESGDAWDLARTIRGKVVDRPWSAYREKSKP